MVIDSSALIAVLEKETEAELFLRLMYEADTLKISAVTYTEASLVLYSRFENPGLVKLDELLNSLAVEFIAFDKTQARLACIAWQRYGKGSASCKAELW